MVTNKNTTRNKDPLRIFVGLSLLVLTTGLSWSISRGEVWGLIFNKGVLKITRDVASAKNRVQEIEEEANSLIKKNGCRDVKRSAEVIEQKASEIEQQIDQIVIDNLREN